MRAESFSSKQISLASRFTLHALYLRKKVLRGALTNGRDWIFLLITLTDDYDGASYKQSAVVRLRTTESLDGQLVNPGPWPDLIAAILSYWVSSIQICAIELSTERDARLKIALQNLEVMIGLNRCKERIFSVCVQCHVCIYILIISKRFLLWLSPMSCAQLLNTATFGQRSNQSPLPSLFPTACLPLGCINRRRRLRYRLCHSLHATGHYKS